MSQIQGQKVSVLIASTLKPVKDVRAYSKLARSLGETNKYRLFIIGFSPKKPKTEPGFRFFSSMSHFDSKLDRVLVQGRFLLRLLWIRPKILICCTFELIPIAAFFKPLIGYQLVYDVQENYLANLDLNPALSFDAKQKAGRLIQKCESAQGIDLYLLAEKCYVKEMPEKQPFLIIENKYQGEIRQKGPIQFVGKNDYKFCITGTITPAFGTLDAILWFIEILKSFPTSKLEILGHCPVDSFRKKLVEVTLDFPQVSLRINPNPIPHQELIDCLGASDFALLPYQSHPAINGKMPTKLYECAALGIPVLISPNPIWEEFFADFAGGYSVDFSNPDTAIAQFKEGLKQTFFTSTPPESILWKTEKAHFQKAIQNLLY
ncbi:hypothetical protein D0X99_09735 [Algoriphagus lacus]|uniref:Glycosyltransferase n=1 Tax=Algoriphagus lacus TaxID=2056311 RepID=A0A418PS49_9BACT|nr:hypothetical protein [Algoriphagus lacus]RIW15696.1 hypothetical protein D0X99_09735 [Algoriphagus lacus]